MPNKPNAPLVYTVAVLQFPRVPEFERYTEKFFTRVREEYLTDDVTKFKSYEASVSDEGIKVVDQERTLWQYMNADKTWAFILSDSHFVLHTNSYVDFNDFARRFRFGLDALNGIEGIGLEYVRSIGIRYVDLVKPSAGSNLVEFLNGWVLPAQTPIDGLNIAEGVHVSKYKTALGQLNLQALLNPTHTLPIELQTALTTKNKWQKERPNTEFAIVDTDHVAMFDPVKKMTCNEIIQTLDDLHKYTKSVFEKMGTPKAMKFWENVNGR